MKMLTNPFDRKTTTQKSDMELETEEKKERNAKPARKTTTQKSDMELETEEKKERNAKPAFPLETALDAAGNSIPLEDGLLTGVPANVDNSMYKSPNKTQFQKESDFWEYKKIVAQKKIEALQNAIEGYEEKAMEAEGTLSPEQQMKRKFEKLQRQRQSLIAKMKEMGIDAEAMGL